MVVVSKMRPLDPLSDRPDNQRVVEAPAQAGPAIGRFDRQGAEERIRALDLHPDTPDQPSVVTGDMDYSSSDSRT